MRNGSRQATDDYAASDDYYSRRMRRNDRDIDRALELTARALDYLGLTGLWRRLSHWVAGAA